MEYTLIYGKRKTLSLTVQPDCTVLVKAPQGYPQAEIARFVQAHEQWIARATARQKQRAEAEKALTEKRIQELRALAEVELPRRVAYFAKQMGVQPTGVKITSAKTRFGSCSAKNSLCFSWRLMLYPPEAIDYVVVHELAHIKEKNHSPAFYKVVASVLPDYKAREKLLKGK
ncbi:MAG: M48 family metallopeptidase [Clostridia bacterium]|nr:M48 family metallopeptidase [Clostridia bacterium]